MAESAGRERLTAEVRARLDRIPPGRFAAKLLVLLMPVWLLESYDIGTIGTTIAVLKPLWRPSSLEIGVLGVASTIAIAVGLAFSGRLVDRIGRRRVLIAGVAWFTVLTGIAGLSPNVWTLVVLRFVGGLALGAVFPLPYVYLAEFLPSHARAKFVGYLNGLLTAAYVVPPLTAIALLDLFDQPVAWRLLYLASLVGLGYAVILVRWLPESPAWLASVGRHGDAVAVVERIERAARERGQVLPDVSVAPPAEQVEGRTPARRPATDIFRGPQLRRTLVVWLAFLGTLPVFYVLLTFAPVLMVDAGYQLTNSLAFVAVLQLAGGVGGLLQGALGDRRGRRPVIVGYGIAAMAGLVLLAVGTSVPVLLVGGLIVGFFGLGIFPVAKLYVAEQFPFDLRGVGSGSTEAFGRFLGGVVFTYLVPYISGVGGTSAVIWVVLVIVGGTTVLPVLFLGRETRGIDIDTEPAAHRVTRPRTEGRSS
jgi:MFS transporter, putative metabolite:H+ symporter